MAHSFVWWAVIWFLEIHCGSQDIKTFQSHLGAESDLQLVERSTAPEILRICRLSGAVHSKSRRAEF